MSQKLFIALVLCVVLVTTVIYMMKWPVLELMEVSSLSQSIDVYTIVTELDNPNLLWLKTSLNRIGHFEEDHVHILLSNDPIGYQKGHGAKIKLFYEAIASIKDKSKLVMLLDGYDLMCVASKEEILSKYLDYVKQHPTKSIVFGAEIFCWPNKELELDYQQLYLGNTTMSPYKFLNSGTIIGPVGDIVDLIKPLYDKVDTKTDDQLFYTQLYLQHTKDTHIQLDMQCAMFQCLASQMKDDLIFDESKQRYYNVKTQTYPCFLHGNGDAKDYLFGVILDKLRVQLV